MGVYKKIFIFFRKRSGISLSIDGLVALSLAYLFSNIVLFLIGWYESYISIPLILVGAWYLYCIYRNPSKLHNEDSSDTWLLHLSDILGLFLLFVILVFGLVKTGLVGGYPSNYDYYIFRNGLYHNLIDAPWPVVLPDKREMTYYLSGLLVPAILSRLTSSYNFQQWLLLLWACVPMFLTFCLLFCKLRRFSWLLVLVGLFMMSPFTVGRDETFLGGLLEYVCEEYFELSWSTTMLLGRWRGSFGLPALLAATAPILTAAIILVVRNRVAVVIPIAMALLVAISPFGAIGVFPLAAVVYFQNVYTGKSITFKEEIVPLMYAILLVCCWGVYFLRSESDVFIGWIGDSSCWGLRTSLMWYVPTQVVLIVLCYHLFMLHKKDIRFLTLIALVAVMPLLFIGSTPGKDFGGLNELWLKCRPTYMVLLAFYLSVSWRKLPKIVLWAWVGCTVVLAARYVIDIGRYDSSIIVCDSLNGHLHHPEYKFLRQSVPDCKEPIVDGVLLRNSGESEQTFPGILLPSAPGCDYSRPLQL